MDENKGYQEDSHRENESTLPHVKESLKRENLIELGKKGMTPFTKILHKYKDEVTPFIGALKAGCDAACRELSNQENESKVASRIVYKWFQESSSMLEEAGSKLNEEDPKIFFDFIKEQSNKRPLLMFSSSYLLGLIAGRISKRQYVDKKSSLH